MPLNGVGLAAALAGAVLAYSGIKGSKVSDTVRGFVIEGKAPAVADVTYTNTDGSVAAAGTSTVGPDDRQSTTTDVGGTPAQNKAIGRLIAAGYGWSTGAQWDALDKLFTRESGWNNTAENASSGAYGIAQALPASKYPTAGQPPTSSASAQIRWGLAYIKSRYNTPVDAWNHEIASNWY